MSVFDYHPVIGPVREATGNATDEESLDKEQQSSLEEVDENSPVCITCGSKGTMAHKHYKALEEQNKDTSWFSWFSRNDT